MELDLDINKFKPKRGISRFTCVYAYYDWLNSFNNESGWSGKFDMLHGWSIQLLENDKRRLKL